MKILAFAGSNHSESINKKLVTFATSFLTEDEIKIIDLNDYDMPIYSLDREKNSFPKPAQQFLDNIAEADVIVISLAEYNRSLSTALKNVIDWSSRIHREVFQQKPMLLLSTSPGGAFGSTVTEHAVKIFPHLGAKVLGTFFLPFYYENFDEENGIVLQEKLEELEGLLKSFRQNINIENK